ncbi:hypothetical protein ANN_12229 [Periplaneta americana]|uniref:Uncharacterized protein n=1 Tax=Periplaneta americana TaxID=6978 RepID=A0ABQ8TI41_PERAM|nr:hypothetical protein ANN_12229 [Periplaneta americana]
MVTYGAETWTKTVGEESLRRWERKVLRRIFGSVKEEMWRIRRNAEVQELYNKTDIVTEIKTGRLRWLGHVMSDKRVFNADDLGEDLRKGVGGYRRWRNREEWARIVQDEALHGL